MADVPHSTTRSSESGLATEPASSGAAVPAWMAARRSRGPSQSESTTEVDSDIEFASIDDTDNVTDEADSVVAPATEIGLPAAVMDQQPVPARQPFVFEAAEKRAEPKPVVPKKIVAAPQSSRDKGPIRVETQEEPQDNSLRGIMMRFFHSAAMAGIAVSILIHAVAICILAVLVIGGAKLHPGLDIFGIMGEPSDNAISDLELDSALPALDPGGGGAPLEFSDMTQMVPMGEGEFDPSTLRSGVGGGGKGSGDGNGDAEGLAVGAGPIPKYAVTKGSFSVWTDPKDPVPTVSYEIVIQFRLPRNIETYRGSDLTGMVIGTDGYKQAIRFNRTENFPVNEGAVQVRIRVPGADRLVRDTIRIESKLLREKQLIEIEF